MGKGTGKDAVVLLDQFDLSNYFNNAEIERDADLQDGTGFGDGGGRKRFPGLPDGSLSLEGFSDADEDAVNDQLEAAYSAADTQVVTVAHEGMAVGKRTVQMAGREASYDTSVPLDGMVAVAGEFLPDDQNISDGVSLHGLDAESSSSEADSVDHGASTADGGVGHLHITANDRDGTVDVKIQDSADDAVYADLVTFTQVAATTKAAERIRVAGTVNRHLKAVWTIAGSSGSATFAVAFARE